MLEAAIGTLANAMLVTPVQIPAAPLTVDVYVVFPSFLLVIFPLLHPLHFDLDSSKYLSISLRWCHPITPTFLLSSLPSFRCYLVADETVAQSSGASAQRFANLHNQKRNSQDASAAARRASFAEMNKAPGFFGGMWQNWTKGTGK